MKDDPIRKLARSRPRPLVFDSDEAFAAYLRDPRPEFEEDHEAWEALLTLAAEKSPRVHSALHCVRCGGAALARGEDAPVFAGRFIDPEEDPERATAWKDADDFQLDCDDILGPHRETIRVLLNHLGDALENGKRVPA